MERQAALELLQCFLEKRGVLDKDLRKDLPGLVAYGIGKSCFTDPAALFEVGEWRNLGDQLWEASLEEDKTAKKLGKSWRIVINALKQHQTEQRLAGQAARRLNGDGEKRKNQTSYPTPPTVSKIILPASAAHGASSSIPPFPPPPVLPSEPEGDPELGPHPWEEDFWAGSAEERDSPKPANKRMVIYYHLRVCGKQLEEGSGNRGERACC